MMTKGSDPRAEELLMAIQDKFAEYDKYSNELIELENRGKMGVAEFWQAFKKANEELNEATAAYKKYVGDRFPTNLN